MRFFLSTRNHDLVRPFTKSGEKTNFICTSGENQVLVGRHTLFSNLDATLTDQVNRGATMKSVQSFQISNFSLLGKTFSRHILLKRSIMRIIHGAEFMPIRIWRDEVFKFPLPNYEFQIPRTW